MNLKPSDWEFKHILKSGIRTGREKKVKGSVLLSHYSELQAQFFTTVYNQGFRSEKDINVLPVPGGKLESFCCLDSSLN